MTQYDPQIHHRRSIRLRDYDYTQQGAYFVTICVEHRECLLGEITDGIVTLSEIGDLVLACWNDIPNHFRHVELDEFMIMPNHVHGILVFTRDAYDTRKGEALADASVNRVASVNANASPLQNPNARPNGTKPRSLNAVMQNFKSVSTRRVNQLQNNRGASFWQRDYYEHIVRNERELERIREYIVNNPRNWANDEYNHPAR